MKSNTSFMSYSLLPSCNSHIKDTKACVTLMNPSDSLRPWSGGGIGMGDTCKPMAVSFQCMTKSTTNKKKIKKKKDPGHLLGLRTV